MSIYCPYVKRRNPNGILRPVTVETSGDRPRSRREEFSDATRAALVTSALRLFADQGYADTSLDQVAGAARVTKGALYHHFDGKRALFAAVFNELEVTAVARVAAAASSRSDLWEGALAATREYLALCAEPDHGRLVVQEGPVALGWATWHAEEERYGLGLTKGMVQQLLDAGLIVDLPLETTSRLVFGMVLASAHLIVAAEDKQAAQDEAFLVISRLLEGLRVPSEADRRGG